MILNIISTFILAIYALFLGAGLYFEFTDTNSNTAIKYSIISVILGLLFILMSLWVA